MVYLFQETKLITVHRSLSDSPLKASTDLITPSAIFIRIVVVYQLSWVIIVVSPALFNLSNCEVMVFSIFCKISVRFFQSKSIQFSTWLFEKICPILEVSTHRTIDPKDDQPLNILPIGVTLARFNEVSTIAHTSPSFAFSAT